MPTLSLIIMRSLKTSDNCALLFKTELDHCHVLRIAERKDSNLKTAVVAFRGTSNFSEVMMFLFYHITRIVLSTPCNLQMIEDLQAAVATDFIAEDGRNLGR